MRAIGVLSRMQVRAESRMLDTCDITYPTGATTTDASGTEIPVMAVRFSTPCRVKVSAGLTVRMEEVGGRTAASVVRELHIPVTSGAVFPNDVAVMTSVHATSDPTLAGASLTLAGASPGSQTTARRLQVSEVLS